MLKRLQLAMKSQEGMIGYPVSIIATLNISVPPMTYFDSLINCTQKRFSYPVLVEFTLFKIVQGLCRFYSSRRSYCYHGFTLHLCQSLGSAIHMVLEVSCILRLVHYCYGFTPHLCQLTTWSFLFCFVFFFSLLPWVQPSSVSLFSSTQTSAHSMVFGLPCFFLSSRYSSLFSRPSRLTAIASIFKICDT